MPLVSLVVCLHCRFLDQELTSYCYSSCCCPSWDDLFKKAEGSIISNRMGWNLAGMFFT